MSAATLSPRPSPEQTSRSKGGLADRARLALDTILLNPVRGIPSWLLNVMNHSHLERIAGAAPGEYVQHPEQVYLAAQQAMGTCMVDQWIPRNPLTMGQHGYSTETVRTATTGAEQIVRDGMPIQSPEDVVAHLEQQVFPALQREITGFDADRRVQEILTREAGVQKDFGPDILKAPYGLVQFPGFKYGWYGYENYFMAYALYPEMLEKHFALQADLAVLNNQAAARAFTEGNLPPYDRLDHDMADSRGTLVKMKSLEKIWFPHFIRSLQPVLRMNLRLIWHCDGNLMEMVPRLLEAGIKGFQGFQYEDGMDYQKICALKAGDGDDLLIIAGSSVTRTLPMGTPNAVKQELKFLVENGPRRGLFLGCSSSIAPGVSWENMETLLAGLQYYRTHGRG